MSQTTFSCPVCRSNNIEYREKKSNPIYFDFIIPILAISTVFQRSKNIIKCKECGYESSVNRKKIKV